MPTDYPRVSMQDVDVVVSNVASGATPMLTITNFEAEQSGDTNDGDAGSVGYKQWGDGRVQWNGTADFQIGADAVPEDLPKRGSQLEIVSVGTIVDGVDLLPDLLDEAAVGKIGVESCRYAIPNTGYATGSIRWRTGYLPRPTA